MSGRTRFKDAQHMLLFSAEWDPVGLVGSGGVLRAIRAESALKQSLVLGRRIPVFAQHQIFDSPHLLALFEPGPPGHEAEREIEIDSLLWLIRHGYVQVKIHPSGLAQPPDGRSPLTLKNAFAAAVARPGFNLTAWPDLEPGYRREFAQLLTGASDAEVPARFATRVAAIEQLDEAFRRSRVSEQARVIPRSLDDFVSDELRQRTERGLPGAFLQPLVEALRRRGRERIFETGDVERPYDLNLRSDWRHLVAGLAAERGYDETHGGVRSLIQLVDLAYNRKVALSCGAPYQREVAASAWAEPLLREDPDLNGLSHEVAFLTERVPGEWLSWTFVKDKLKQGLVATDPFSDGRGLRRAMLAELAALAVSGTAEAGALASPIRVWSGIGTDIGVGAAGTVVTYGAALTGWDPLTAGLAGVAAGATVGHLLRRLNEHLAAKLVGRPVGALTAELRTHAERL